MRRTKTLSGKRVIAVMRAYGWAAKPPCRRASFQLTLREAVISFSKVKACFSVMLLAIALCEEAAVSQPSQSDASAAPVVYYGSYNVGFNVTRGGSPVYWTSDGSSPTNGIAPNVHYCAYGPYES